MLNYLSKVQELVKHYGKKKLINMAAQELSMGLTVYCQPNPAPVTAIH
jgi:hypothetical protein